MSKISAQDITGARNTRFSEAKAGFELFSNFARLNLNDDRLLNNIN
jgi:hypothetical protein